MTPAEQHVADEYLAHGFQRVVVRDDEPGFAYPVHYHNYTLVLHVITGELSVTVNHRHTTAQAGQQVSIPANAMHSVLIGANGCRYLHAEQVARH